MKKNTAKKHWFAVYVKMHHERKVRDRLSALGIENFLPIREEIRQWSDRRKKIERLLIPMIVFVRVADNEHITVLKQPQVSHFLTMRSERKPAVIPDKQVEDFRFLVENAENDVLISNENFDEGDWVRVIKGSLVGLEGKLIQTEGKHRIAVQIEQLGFATVELNAGWVEVVKNNHLLSKE